MKKVLVLLITFLVAVSFVSAQNQPAPSTGGTAQTDQPVQPTDQAAGDQTMGAGNSAQGTGQTAQQADQTAKPSDQSASGQSAQPADQSGSGQSAGQAPATVSVARQKISKLIGYDIVNADSKKIGEVKDFVITSDGKVPYATARFDDVKSDGDVLVPVQAITFGTAEGKKEAATVSFDVKQVQGAPVVKDNQLGSGWEQTASSFWADKVAAAKPAENQALGSGQTSGAAASGSQASGTAASGGQAFLASRLLDYDVKGSDNKSVGNVKDIMVDLDKQQVAYVAMGVGGILGIGEKLFAIPLNEFQVNSDKKELALNVNGDFFDNAKGFENNNWPAEASQTWQQDIQSQKQADQAQKASNNGQSGAMTSDQSGGTMGSGNTSGTATDKPLQTQDESSGAPAQGDKQQ